MALRDELKEQGDWLFKYRSYLPLMLLPLAVLAIISGSFLPENQIVIRIYEIFCLLISMTGLIVRIFTIGYAPDRTSGRNTDKQIADVLNTSGIYSIVRHPLYLGNFLMWLGIVLFVQSLWFVFVFCLLYWIYYERIMYAEETFLESKFGKEFIEWSERIPPFIPDFRLWQKSDLNFSLKKVLRKENSGFFGMITCFTFLHIFRNYIRIGSFLTRMDWIIIFCLSLMIYLILRFLKKKTKILSDKN